jgi:GT2 family glycosyltransferase
MLGLAQDPTVGLVGAMLYFDDETIQHAGHVYHAMTPSHIGYGMDPGEIGPGFAFRVERECSGVTAACAMIRKSVFYEVGGMSTLFAVNYNDVDLSQKIRSTGRRIIWTPYAKLFHFESKSRAIGIGAAEVGLVRRRWGRLLEVDPYWR